MRKLFAILVMAVLIFTVSCTDNAWKGFDNEDLSKYVVLGEYKGLTYNKPEINIDPNTVEEQINAMLEAASELVETERGATSSSAVKIDRYCFLNGVSTPELSVEGQTYYIDAEYDDVVIDAIRMACIGAKKGDTINVNLTLPAGYKGIVEQQANAEFRVTVLNVYEKITPQLNDKTAQMLIPGCNTVDDLRNTVTKRLEKQLLDVSMDKIRAELKERLINSSTVKKLPVTVLNAYYEDSITLYKRLADALEMSLEEYAENELAMTGEELESMVAGIANARTKEVLVLYSVVKKENIIFTDAVLMEYAEKMAARSEGIFKSGEEYLSYYGKNAVAEDYLWEKVVDKMIEYASVE